MLSNDVRGNKSSLIRLNFDEIWKTIPHKNALCQRFEITLVWWLLMLTETKMFVHIRFFNYDSYSLPSFHPSTSFIPMMVTNILKNIWWQCLSLSESFSFLTQWIFKPSHETCSIKKVVHKDFAKFTGKHQ